MNIIILKILLSVISGIVLGLYLKNIAFFIYILIIIIYFVFKYKSFKNKKENMVYFDRRFNFVTDFIKRNIANICILIFSIIIFLIAFYTEEKYENLYQENIKFSGIGEIISFAEEKDYTNKYIIKITQINNDYKYKNTKLIIYIDKNINLEYGDIIYFSNSNFEKASERRNDNGFDYERYLRQSKIYGILNLENFEIISQNRGIVYNFFKFKNELKNILYENFSSENAGFLAGILFRR